MMLMLRFRAYVVKFPVSPVDQFISIKPYDKADLQLDQENVKRKNEELIQAFREKSRKQLQTQELYDKLKQRAMLGHVQNAASDAVNHSIQTSVTANRFMDRMDAQNLRPSQHTLVSGMRDSATHLHHRSPPSVMSMAPIMGRSGTGDWAGFRSNQENIAR
jgi:E3 ubiquitin-protein ligase CCNP1IP1